MHDTRKHVKSAWISKRAQDNKTDKPWGHEESWSGFSGIHGKSLFIKKGCRTSLKYHNIKNEVLFIRSGEVQVCFGDELSLKDPVAHPMKIKMMQEGDTLMVQSGSPYRITALTNCEIIEIGNNLSDKPVRLEDDYGRSDNTDKTPA